MSQGAPSRGSDAPREPAKTTGKNPRPDSGNGTPEVSEQALERMLGEFRILRSLGKGGMAEVFLAEQTSLKRNVAIKVLLQERLTDPTYLKRFKTEATAAAALSHPNIVQVFMIGEHEGTHYIAQEYVQGMNLREYLARKGPPEGALIVRVMKQVASALHAAHAAGIVHRDIKPENIMLTRKGEIKVADFGLAQLTQGGEKVHLTQVGVTMGTPLYMSPEQVNGKKVDQRSDIYSFGVSCYHLASGTPPFRGDTAISVAVQHLKQEPDRLESIRGDLPPVLCRIIRKMMAKDPSQRYQTAQDLLKDLKRMGQGADDSEGHTVASVEAAEGPSDSPPAGRMRRWGRTVWRLGDLSWGTQAGLLLCAGLLTGAASAGVGWLAREPNPLEAPHKGSVGAPKLESAVKQYFYAQGLKTSEAAWQAVIDHWPEEPRFQNFARQQLALLHLAKGRYAEAQELFDYFAQMRKSEPQWRTFGLAGQSILLHRQGQYEESQRIFEQLKPNYDKLDGPMRNMITKTVERNLQQLNKELDDGLRSLFQGPEEAADETRPGN
ncbi:MAG: protein kinase domain-containing protein [Planctomycetales bacterium]